MANGRWSAREWLTAGFIAALAVAAVALILLTLTRGEREAPVAAPGPTDSAAPGRPAPPAFIANRVEELGRQFGGRTGIAVRSVEDGWTASFRGAQPFPQQSISKLWVAAAVLERIDKGELSLDDPVTVTTRDLTIFHQPIRKAIGPAGFRTTIGDLMRRAIVESDNTANDVLFRRAGGQAGVSEFLARQRLGAIAVGPGEKQLQIEAAGMTWQDRYSHGRTFWRERKLVPVATRARALGRYVVSPPDGASPDALVTALARLRRGELLSPGSTAHLLALMNQSTTGPDRLRGGLAEGWSLAHKTGTGQVMGTYATAYNDSGVLTSPSGRRYALAVLIGSTMRPVPERQALMQAVTRAVIECESVGEDGC